MVPSLLSVTDLPRSPISIAGRRRAAVAAGGAIELSSLNGANGFVLNGIDAFDFSGTSVSSAGAVHGHGTDELLIWDPELGRATWRGRVESQVVAVSCKTKHLPYT